MILTAQENTESANGGKGGSLGTKSWGGIFDRYTGGMKNASNGGNGYVKIEYSKNWGDIVGIPKIYWWRIYWYRINTKIKW